MSHQGFVAEKKNRLALRFLLPRVAMNIVISQGLKRWYETELNLQFADNAEIIYNGVDEKRLAWRGETLKRTQFAIGRSAFRMIANFTAIRAKTR